MKIKFLSLIFISLLFCSILNSCRRGNIDIIDIKSEIENCSLPYIVNFEVELTYQGNDIEYYWEFGDGATSKEKNPVHIYTTKGAYVATLKVNNYDATEEKTIPINIQNETIPVISDFDYKIVYNDYAPAEVEFENLSEHSADFFWDFGDGIGNSDFETNHIFESAGSFSTSLRAVCNGDTVYHTETIKILSPPDDIIIKGVKVWLPSSNLNKRLELKFQYSIFNETPTSLSDINATSLPVYWTMYQELFFFDGIYDSEIITFQVWDSNYLSTPIYTFAISTYNIAQKHYPTVITWDDGNGYSAEVSLEYN